MPTTKLRQITKTQPMREGEIALFDYINGDLTSYLQEETQERINEDTELQTELDAEIQRAQKAEDTLQANIEAEQTRAEAAEKLLTDNLADEVTRATAAETTLTGNLSAEVTRAKAAEKVLTDDLNAETQRATTAESELSGKIQAEQTRATEAEAGIEEHLHTAEEEINTKIAGLGGTGLTYSAETGKLNLKQADQQTLGGTKLTHEVNNDTSDEWAVTSDGVYKYAPSKAETINQPDTTEFTNVQEGVTITQQNAVRIGGIMFMNIRVQCGTAATVSSNTKFATPPACVGGVGIGCSMSGVGIQISQVSLMVSKALEPNSDTYFTVVFPYKVNGGN